MKKSKWRIDQRLFPELESANHEKRLYLCGTAGEKANVGVVRGRQNAVHRRRRSNKFPIPDPVILVHSSSDPGMKTFKCIPKRSFSVKFKNAPLASRAKKFGMPAHLLQSSYEEVDVLSGYYRKVLAKSSGRRQLEESKKAGRSLTEVEKEALAKIRKVAEKSLESSKCHADLRGFQGKGLDPRELRYRLRTHFNVYLDDRELAVVFQHFDADGDGTVDFEEMLSQFLHPERLRSDGAAHRQKRLTNVDYYKSVMDKLSNVLVKMKDRISLTDLFKTFDLDKSGTISRDEFSNALAAVGLELTYHETKACFLYLDPDNDGHVDFTEFMKAYFNRRSIVSQLRRQERKRLRPPFVPCNPYRAKELITHQADINLNTIPEGIELQKASNQKEKGEAKPTQQPEVGDLPRNVVFKPFSVTSARSSIARNIYLNSPDDVILNAQRGYIKRRAAENRARLRFF